MTTIPYRPSNGTEGSAFADEFCHRCKHDQEWMQHGRNPCPIFSRTLALPIDHPDYPTEWIQNDLSWKDYPDTRAGLLQMLRDRRPRCTAFEPID